MKSIKIKLLQEKHREAFLEAAQDSQEFHKPWVNPPLDNEEFSKLIERSKRENMMCFVLTSSNEKKVLGIYWSFRNCRRMFSKCLPRILCYEELFWKRNHEKRDETSSFLYFSKN